MQEQVGVILVNYKDYVDRFLAECRDTLRQQSYPRDLLKVYIVDNASSERSRRFIRDNYPEAVVIPREDGNYAAANNAGIKKAMKEGCEYFIIANMDTAFDREWADELVKAHKSLSRPGMVQSKMLLYPETPEERQQPRINSLGNIMNFLGFGFTNGYREPDKGVRGMPEIGYASGCSFITSKEVIADIGYYDEEYWMYHDDIEMGWRARAAGYGIYLAPASVVYHKYEFSRSVRMLYYMERNRYLAVFHYYKWQTLLLVLPALVAMEFGMLFYSVPGKWLGTKLRADLYFCKPSTWSKIIKKRKTVNSIRREKDKKVVDGFSGQVLFQEVDNPVLKHIANPVFDLYWNTIKKMIVW